MAGQNKDTPQFPRLLLCEGPEDRFFFHRLIEERGLPRFHIWHAGGNSRYDTALRSFEVERPKTLRQCRDIVIVADNDESPDVSFDNVCKQLNSYFGAGTAPFAPRQRTKTAPSLSVLMVPWDQDHGHLERLCIDSAKDADKEIGGFTEDFLAQLRADKWGNESRYGKAWLRANLAARCVNDPFVPLGVVFEEARHRGLIPVAHKSFDRIAAFLGGF